uniref:Sulfotransferase domain-containing protein n=1 Tax=Strigamia maritima TaxID=126957 RepID=T1IQT7_STRMM
MSIMEEKESEELSFPDWEHDFDQPPKLCRVLKYDVVLPSSYNRLKARLSTFEPRDDDIWVVTFPKSGTTWTQEIVSFIINRCDMDKNRVLLDQRFPFFEADLFYSTPIRPTENVVDWLNHAESPRLIKSHLPLNVLPNKVNERCKIIYMARNPKDVMVSMFYFYKMLRSKGFRGEFSSFVAYFMQDKGVKLLL